MNTIERPVAQEAVTGFNRIARHETFMVLSDLNMIQQVRVITVDENNVPLCTKIQEDPNLSDTQRLAALARYQDQIVNRQTTNAFVDATGKVVSADTEGAIPQRDFFQALTLGQLKALGFKVTDKTTVASLLYFLIGNEIDNINSRGDL